MILMVFGFRKKRVLLSLLSLVVAAFTVMSPLLSSSGVAQDAQTSAVLEALSTCFPTPTGAVADQANGQSYQLALLNSTPVVESDGRSPYRSYYLFAVYSPWAPERLDYSVIGQDGEGRCGLVVEPGSDFDLTWDVSFESAKQLASVFYGWLHSTPEGQAWIQSLIAPADYSDEEEDLLYLSAEQGWALQQLGYQIPDDYEVLEPGTPSYLENHSS